MFMAFIQSARCTSPHYNNIVRGLKCYECKLERLIRCHLKCLSIFFLFFFFAVRFFGLNCNSLQHSNSVNKLHFVMAKGGEKK